MRSLSLMLSIVLGPFRTLFVVPLLAVTVVENGMGAEKPAGVFNPPAAPLDQRIEGSAFKTPGSRFVVPPPSDFEQTRTSDEEEGDTYSAEFEPEIRELAHGLRNDPYLIYDFVHNNIRHVNVGGGLKGPLMCLVDGEGSTMDQAELLAALLRAAGHTAETEDSVGIILTGREYMDWSGIEAFDANEALLQAGGWQWPEGIESTSSNTVAEAEKEHVIVRLTMDGTNYLLDPSYKVYDGTDGINIASALGYERAAFSNAAMEGAVLGEDYVQHINTTNIQRHLTSLASNLTAFIATNMPACSLSDLIGEDGVQAVHTTSFTTNLPHIEFYSDPGISWQHAALRLWKDGGSTGDISMSVPEFYGKRLSLVHVPTNGMFTPVLSLGGEVIHEYEATAAGTWTLRVSIDHPYTRNEGCYADEYFGLPINTSNMYVFCSAWGNTSRRAVERHRERLNHYLALGMAPDSEAVQGEAMQLLGTAWSAQVSHATRIGDHLAGTRSLLHHAFIAVSQGETLTIDAPMMIDIVNLNGVTYEFLPRLYAMTIAYSAMEWGIIEQMQPHGGASTVNMLSQANAEGNKFFKATHYNYSEVKTNLVGYSSNTLATIQAYMDNYATAVLPEHGDLQRGDSIGDAYYLIDELYGGMAAKIGIGLNGGSGTTRWHIGPQHCARQMKGLRNADDNPRSLEPIDLLTGHYIDRKADIAVGNGSLPFGLTFTRSYNSGQYHQNSGMGLGWSHNLDGAAIIGSDAFRGMGSESGADAAESIAAIYVAMDQFVIADRTVQASHVVVATLVHEWFMENLIDNVVDITVADNTTRFLKAADGSYRPPPTKWGQLAREPDSSFAMTTKHGDRLDFNTNGLLAMWQDLNSNAVTFAYTSNNVVAVSNGMGRGLLLTYDGNGRIETVTDHTGRGVTYSYDAHGNLSTTEDPEGNVSSYEYDVPGRLTKAFRPSSPTSEAVENVYTAAPAVTNFSTKVFRQIDFDGNAWDYYYARGRRSEEIDPTDASTVLTFDENGRVTQIVDALSRTNRLEFDGIGRVVSTTAPEGDGQEFEYDARGNVVRTVALPKTGSAETPMTNSLAYDPVHNRLLRQTDAVGRVTDYTYDAAGNLTRLELPTLGGARPTYVYTVNSRGQVAAVEGPDGRRRSYAYDPITGDLLSRTVDPEGLAITQSFEYDAVGNVIHVTDPLGRRLTAEYGNNRHVVRSEVPAPFGYETRSEYDVDGNLARIRRQTGDAVAPWQDMSVAYNLAGEPVRSTDALGRVTAYVYDSRQRPWKTTGPGGRVTEFLQDAYGRTAGMVDPLGNPVATYDYTASGELASLADGKGNRVTNTYDGFGRTLTQTFEDGTRAEAAYDDAGNVTQSVTRAGDAIAVEYDALDRRVRRNVPGIGDVQYAYDLANRLTNATDATGSVSMVYDSAGRLVSVTDLNGRTVSYAYDTNGNRTRLGYPDGYALRYEYDELNRLSAVRKEGATNVLADYAYDPLSRVTRVTYGNGVVEATTFLADDKLSGIRYAFTDGAVTLGYTYDERGLIEACDSSHRELLFIPSNSGTSDFVPNELNQYTLAGGQAHTFDGNGNLLSDGVNAYTYDALNRLTGVSNALHTLSYRYDPLGRRLERVADGAATTFVYDGPHVVAEYDGSGAVVRRYVYGPGLDDLILMETSGGTYYLHQDRLMSVVALSDGSGNRIESFAYSPWGEPSRVSVIGCPFLFNGRRYEEEVGLYCHRARYYSPALGRYLSPDPLGIFGGDANLYTYAGNTPANMMDPLGLYSTHLSSPLSKKLVHKIIMKVGKTTRKVSGDVYSYYQEHKWDNARYALKGLKAYHEIQRDHLEESREVVQSLYDLEDALNTWIYNDTVRMVKDGVQTLSEGFSQSEAIWREVHYHTAGGVEGSRSTPRLVAGQQHKNAVLDVVHTGVTFGGKDVNMLGFNSETSVYQQKMEWEQGIWDKVGYDPPGLSVEGTTTISEKMSGGVGR